MKTKFRMWDIISTETYGSPYEIVNVIAEQNNMDYLVKYSTDASTGNPLFTIQYLPEYPVIDYRIETKPVPMELFKVPWDE